VRRPCSDLRQGAAVVGLEPNIVVTIAATAPAGDAVTVFYRLPDGSPSDRLVTPADLASLSLATTERPWSFDGDGEAFQLACEARRIDLAFLFDPMMAVHASNVQPLPHQISAVYEKMLPRQPLRYVLADDPGAGKTIMAGLYIRELIMRADGRRILIVAPGSLVDQWKTELFEKFGLEFQIYSTALDAADPGGNAFESRHQLIVRLDQMARNPDLQRKLVATGWDLVIFDEAHKLAAHYFGSKLEKTSRYELAELLGGHTRHLLLMTATPHNGKEEDYQLFLALLDGDRFYGKFRDGVHKVDATDLMRRMVKEDLITFDNKPLFPPRRAYTVNYDLSPLENDLYEAVTDYVQTEMGKADRLSGAQKNSVGFALTTLQRRLASSPEAIYQSLKRRHQRLEERLREERMGGPRRRPALGTLPDSFAIPDDDDDLSADEQEQLEEAVVDEASTARTVQELEAEIEILKGLEEQAKQVVHSGQDRKWDELSQILQNAPEMRDASGKLRKLIIFTEHRDTLNYLERRISGVLGSDTAVDTIHGGTVREQRLATQALFRSESDLCVLIATDAAGEGVNLQTANLMVNYDLPWNPNRLEQRFGRIHRIGQPHTCHLWNLVAAQTREGAVYHRLLTKMETLSEALQGRVFDILGEVFEEKSLKDLMIEAVKYGNAPAAAATRLGEIDRALDRDHVLQLLDRGALATESFSPDRLYAVKEEMEKAEARRLQPHFVKSFFLKAFSLLGGQIEELEPGRYEITFVPESIRDRDRLITGRNRRDPEPVLRRYTRVCFEKSGIQIDDRPDLPQAVLLHPGHPLMLSVTDIVRQQHANLLRQGAVLCDPDDDGSEPWLLFLLTHEVKSGDGAILSKRLQFVRVNADGSSSFAGWAPHLDLEPIPVSELPLHEAVLKATWIKSDLEQKAVALAATELVPQHFKEIADRRVAHVDKTLTAVHDRLTREIDFWSDRYGKLKDDLAAGKDVRLNLDNARRLITDLQGRLDRRKRELQAMRHVVNGTPVVLGGALVIPAGLRRRATGDEPPDAATACFAADAAARKRIEMAAMEAVRRAEEARGCIVKDVSADQCGWDITSWPRSPDGSMPVARHIEVKGRVKGASTVTISHNEVMFGFNQGDKFLLAIVLVGQDGSTEGPYYVRRFVDHPPAWGTAGSIYHLHKLLERAEPS